MLEKATSIKRFEYTPLGKELKKQTSVAENQYQKKKMFNKNEEKAKKNQVYNNYFTFCKYHKTKEFNKHSPGLILNYLNELFKLGLSYYDTEEIKPNNEDKEKDLEKTKVGVNAASRLYGKLLNIYKTQCNKLLEDQKKRISVLIRSENLSLNFI